MYTIQYLPIATRDLDKIFTYICEVEKEPQNAMELLNAFDAAVKRLELFPYSCPLYIPIREIGIEYRKLSVKSFGIYYTVQEHRKVIEIHRVLSQKMNIPAILG